ncbi:MAG TPA: sigma 54-interacting transcriptional regulator [Candidatus Binatia bacterium]
MGGHGEDEAEREPSLAGQDLVASSTATAGSFAGLREADVLRLILEGTSRSTGGEFLQSLVRSLAAAIDVQFAFVAEFDSSPAWVRTLAFYGDGRFMDNVAWDLTGTPCEDVVRGNLCHHASNVYRIFPRDLPLVERRIESYLGVPLCNADGKTIGHLAVFDRRPMPIEATQLQMFRIFASRAAAELERIEIERKLRFSERQFRDLFEEAPIAYVYEETDTRFLSANRAFMELLGLAAGDVPGTYGMSLVAPQQDNRDRVHESLASEQEGRQRSAIEIELRRKDNGKSVWVQRWSKPEPDGKHTRTMIVDITARVLAERERARLQQQNAYLREEIRAEHDFETIVGSSAAIRQVMQQVQRVAPTDSTVLILGETGTGKELIARAVHDLSGRKDRPLIKVNAGALPAGLVESELFGHEKGAFTGASERRVGRFALADKGTLFLDEIGEMPLDVQVKLLRVLQEREFEAVGSTRPQRVDVRVVAATNRDLETAVAEGKFRSDLYFRVNVFVVRVPPLRDRREDIPLLVRYFMSRYGARLGRRFTEVDPATMARLRDYPWPGNIRELENVVERAMIVSDGPVLEIDESLLAVKSAPRADREDAARTTTLTAAAGPTLGELERQRIEESLERCGWVIEGSAGAAAMLGLHPNTLRSRLKRLGISRRR